MKLLRSSQHYWFALALMMVIGSMTNLAVKATVPDSWQRGLAYTAWWHDLYLTPESDQSLELLDSTGANWISLLVTCYQNKLSSTRIDCPTRSLTPTDASLVHAI
ncbi:hypothetical protein HY009_07310, partial [Candidatus Acetothermia bacterium]|nr:hypothetical protein [Candidatus Acetothermia bacterium]